MARGYIGNGRAREREGMERKGEKENSDLNRAVGQPGQRCSGYDVPTIMMVATLDRYRDTASRYDPYAKSGWEV